MEEGNTVFSIRDLENFSGIKAHTIRIWEKRYNILEPDRTDSNIRTYNESELKKILNVSFLNRKGLKISKIARLSDDEIAQLVMEISSGADEGNQGFEPGKTLISAIKYDEDLFRDKLMPYVRSLGLEEAYLKFLHPLLEKSAILWQTGTLSRSQEQFIRNIIRQIIISEDFRLLPSNGRNKSVFAIINTATKLPDNNLLFYKYIIRKRGFGVLYTGGILPASEIIEIFKIRPFDYLVVNSKGFDFARNKASYFTNLGKSLMLKKTIFTDSCEEPDRKYSENIFMTADPAGFIRLIDSLS